MFADRLVRLLSWTEQAEPFLSHRREENCSNWEAIPKHAREQTEEVMRLNAEAARVHMQVMAGELTEEEAAARTHKIDQGRQSLGKVDQKAWVAYRRILGWRFLEEVQEREGTPVPIWAYSADGVNDAPAHVLGPCIALLRTSVLVLFATQIFVFAVAATWPGFRQSIFRWLALLPSVLVAFFADWKTSRRFMVPYLYRLGDARMKPFAVSIFKVPLEHLWVWAGYGAFNGYVNVLQNFTGGLAAGLLFMSLKRGSVFNHESQSLKGYEVFFLACWAWKLLHFAVPLVTTYRKGELTGSGFNALGDHGKGKTICSGQVFNDDVALSLAEAAGASVLKSYANKFAQAHVRTARAPILAVKTASSQATRVFFSLLTTKVPLSAQLVLQGLILKIDASERVAMSQGAWLILLNTLVGICLGLLDVMNMKDFEAMIGELVASVEAAKRIGLWKQDEEAEARDHAYSQIFVFQWLARICAVTVVLCSGIAAWCIVTVLRAEI